MKYEGLLTLLLKGEEMFHGEHFAKAEPPKSRLREEHFDTIAQKPNLHPSIQKKLASNPSAKVAYRLIHSQKNLHWDAIKNLVNHPDSDVPLLLARRASTNPQIADIMKDHPHPDVHQIFLQIPNISSAQKERINNPTPELEAKWASYPNYSNWAENKLKENNLPLHLQHAFADNIYTSIAGGLARKKGLDPSVRQKLVNHKARWVQQKIAGNPDLTEEEQHKLLDRDSPDGDVAISLSDNENLYPSVFERLIPHHHWAVWQNLRDNYSPQITREHHRKLRDFMAMKKSEAEPPSKVRDSMKRNPSYKPMSKFEPLYKAEPPKRRLRDEHLHMIVEEGNPPLSLQEDFAYSTKPYLRNLVAKSPNLHPSLHEKLANDGDDEVRMTTAKNPNLDPSIHEKLVNDKNIYIRYSIAQNPNLHLSIQEKLANDKNLWVRHELAGNPNLHPSLHEKLADDKNWEVRANMALHPNLHPSVHEKLLNDKDPEVQESMRINLKRRALKKSEPLYKTEEKKGRLRAHHLEAVADTLERYAENTPALLSLQRRLYNQLDKLQHTDSGSRAMNNLLSNPSLHPDLQREIFDRHNPEKEISDPSAYSGRAGDWLKIAHLAGNKSLDPSIQKEISDFHTIPTSFVANQSLSLSTQRKLFNKISPAQAGTMALNGNLHPEMQEKFANHSNTSLREKLAGNPRITDEIHQKMMNDPWHSVRLYASYNPKTSPEDREKIHQDHKKEIASRMGGLPTPITESQLNGILDVMHRSARNPQYDF
jgi:hypothetical protein